MTLTHCGQYTTHLAPFRHGQLTHATSIRYHPSTPQTHSRLRALGPPLWLLYAALATPSPCVREVRRSVVFNTTKLTDEVI